jgi:hypothetical protein
MSSWGDPGLVDCWVEAETAHQLPRALEAADVADRGHKRRRGHEVDTRHGERQPDRALLERRLGDDLVEAIELVAEELKLAETGGGGASLIVGELDGVEPAEPLTPTSPTPAAARPGSGAAPRGIWFFWFLGPVRSRTSWPRRDIRRRKRRGGCSAS